MIGRLFAALLFVALLPFLAAISIAIVIESGLPALFRQTRVGRDGRPFRLLKFRSMRHEPTGVQITQAGDNRVTRAGKFLRRYKLDELPQFWNVVRGDMALVGPRPEVPRFVDLQDPLWIATLSVRPGITDLATLVYRDEETVLAGAENVEEFYRRHVLPDKLRLNSDYLQFRTWRTDLRILFLTALGSLFPATCDPQRIRKQFPSVSPSSRVTQIS